MRKNGWDITKIPPGIWYSAKQIADFVGVNRRQVSDRCRPGAVRKLPDGLIVRRYREVRGPVTMIQRQVEIPARSETEK